MRRSSAGRRRSSQRTMLPSARKARSPWSWRRPRTLGSRCVRSGSQDQSVDVLVEIPRGSRSKYEMDQKTGRIRLDRVLFSSVHYPADYGFVMETIRGDGDPLDALVVVEEPTFPGCVVPSRPIGTLLLRHLQGARDQQVRRGERLARRRRRVEAHQRRAGARAEGVVNREYRKWWSPALGRDMELLVFGDRGAPVLVFPTSMGRFYQWEDFGIVSHMAPRIDAGWLQLWCVDSIDGESFYNKAVAPQDRARRHLAYERYLVDEVLPAIRYANGVDQLIVAGSSFGAFHALAFVTRRPGIARRCVRRRSSSRRAETIRTSTNRGGSPAFSNRRVCPPSSISGTAGLTTGRTGRTWWTGTYDRESHRPSHRPREHVPRTVHRDGEPQGRRDGRAGRDGDAWWRTGDRAAALRGDRRPDQP